MPAENSNADFEGWAILELMGHRKLAGKVVTQEIAGAKFFRIDIPAKPGPDGKPGQVAATQFYHPQSLYGFTPVTEEVARAVAVSCQPEPVTRWDVRNLLTPASTPSPTQSSFDELEEEEDFAEDDDDDYEPQVF